MNQAQRLHAAGQSLWIDSINRRMLTEGTLRHYIDDLAVTGLTSNPTILGHAMAESTDYDDSIARHVAAGTTDPEQLVLAIALEDIVDAADLFRPVWEDTHGVDGYVSIEVPPGLAYDAPRSIEVARALHAQADRPNVFIKIPGTPAGLTAMEELVAEGVGINVTLLFSNTHYLRTADAYLRALERRAAAGQRLDVPSVASIFVSRWDRTADPDLPTEMHGRLGLAVCSAVEASYVGLRQEERWQVLAAAGARPQRVLWASTSTKDPALPDTYYVDHLVAEQTVNTMPEPTLLAYADHGPDPTPMDADLAASARTLARVAQHGVNVDALGEQLQRDGARAFEKDWANLLGAIAAKVESLAASTSGH